MKMNKDYNGWANFETWLIDTELMEDWFNTLNDEEIKKLNWEDLRRFVEDAIIENKRLAKNYANLFIKKVDFREILDAYRGNDEDV